MYYLMDFVFKSSRHSHMFCCMLTMLFLMPDMSNIAQTIAKRRQPKYTLGFRNELFALSLFKKRFNSIINQVKGNNNKLIFVVYVNPLHEL